MSRTESRTGATSTPTSSDHLTAACQSLGLNVRKHTPEIYGWGEREPTVIDLAPDEQQILAEQGPAALDAALQRDGGFLFPASDITAPRAIQHSTPLVHQGRAVATIVYPKASNFYQKLAHDLAQLTAPALALCDDEAFGWQVHRNGPLIILGGSHENRAALDLTCWQLNFLNANVPGPKGWAVHTLHGLVEPAHNIILAAADRSTRKALLDAFRNALTNDDNSAELARFDQTHLGPDTAEAFGEAEQLLNECGPRLELSDAPTFDQFVDALNARWDSGGRDVGRDNGHSTVPAITRAYYAYRCTGDRRFLDAVRGTLLGLCDYFCNIAGGASYPSDYDFHLGPLITAWSIAEAEDVFSEDERLVITSVLLASARTCEKYQQAKWPLHEGALRHNHETFPALTSYWAARYFGTTYGIADAARWREIAAFCFSGPIDRVSRHTENSNMYQWLVPMHKLAYDAAEGRIGEPQKQIVRDTVHAIRTATDNFGYSAPYGDSEPISSTTMQTRYLQGAAALTGDADASALAAYCVQAIGSFYTLALPQPGLATLLFPSPTKKRPRRKAGWEEVPMAPHVPEKYQPSMPAKYVRDKIAMRSDWGEREQYLLFEPYSCESHAHRDMNAIIAYNHRGRMWLVDNGYGKPVDVEHQGKAYSQRETGPNAHNTLIFRDGEGEIVVPPPFGAVTACRRRGDLHWLQSTLANIEGCTWQRSVLVKLDSFLLVIDRVLADKQCRIATVECQFNALGEATLAGEDWRLSQNGVHARLRTVGPGTSEQGSYITSGWRGALANLYPHAEEPVKQLSRRAKVQPGEELRFVTLFEASDTADGFGYDLQGERIRGAFAPDVSLTGHGIKATTQDDALELAFKPSKLLPRGLKPGDFGPTGVRKTKRH